MTALLPGTALPMPTPSQQGRAGASFPVTEQGVAIPKVRLMWQSFVVFFSELVDDTGKPLQVSRHHELWAEAMQEENRLVLMAPRDHGKTWTSLAYLMWRAWRHNRRPDGSWDTSNPDGMLQLVLFSSNYGQTGEFFLRLQTLILANEELFADILPTDSRGPRTAIREAWTGGFVRFKNFAQIATKSAGTDTRGLHPDVIICDDILSDGNSATKYQRDKIWKYFIGTINPMLGPEGQLILIGTAQHYSDLLHRLRPTHKHKTGFRWMKFRAVNWESGQVLWPERHDLDDLKSRQNLDPVLFSKEFQNDPRDDASSIFPHTLLDPAIEQGAHLSFMIPGQPFHKQAGTLHVLSADMAMSESVGADFCVINVAKLDLNTQQRTLLYAVRERGWDFQTQVRMLRDLTRAFDVDLGVIENNSFQRWVAAELRKFPETATKIVGHTTGIEKQSLAEGVPSLVIGLRQKLWTIPYGDEQAQQYSTVWKSEMNAFGWVNNKLQGAGEHDDTVMAFWLLDRACRIVNTLLMQGPKEQYVSMKDVGLDRVQIGADW